MSRTLRAGNSTTVSTATQGFVEVEIDPATEADALAGTNNTKAVTALRVQQKLDARSQFLLPSGDDTGATDDANIVAAKAELAAGTVQRIRFGPGKFYVTDTLDFTDDDDLYAAVIQGEGHGGSPADTNPHATQIVMLTDNVPILKVWGAQRVDGLCLIYDTQQTTSDTAAIGCSMNNLAGASVSNIRVWNAHISFGIPQAGFAATGVNIAYNSVFRGLHSWKASQTHFDVRNYSGGGTNCRVGPLYINGGGSLDFVTPGQSCNYAIRGATMLGWEFGAISVDGLIINERLVDFSAGSNYFTINTIRCEAVDWNRDNEALITLGGSSNLGTIDVFELKNTRWTPSTTTTMYLLRTNATRNVLDVGAIIIDVDCDFGSSGTRRALLNGAGDDGSNIRVHSIIDPNPELSDTTWTDGISTLQTPVRVWSGRWINDIRQAGRTGVIYREASASAAPTTGTWAVGDRVWNSVPTAGGFIGWVCTTAGTPGTWKTFGAITA